MVIASIGTIFVTDLSMRLVWIKSAMYSSVKNDTHRCAYENEDMKITVLENSTEGNKN